jgi:hypothetical protein
VAGQFTAGFSNSGMSHFKFSPPAIADLNDDGFPDLMWPGTDTVRYSLQVAGGAGQYGPVIALGSSNAQGFATGRINDDELDDAVVFESMGQIFLQNPVSHTLQLGATVQPFAPEGVAIVDVNADGNNDIAAGDEVLLACEPPMAAGSFPGGAPPVRLSLGNAHHIVYEDMTGDGKVEAVGLDPPGGLLVYAIHQ